MVENDTGNAPYKNTIEEAVSSFNERIIRRYAKRKDTTVDHVKLRLAADPDFLKGKKFSLPLGTTTEADFDPRAVLDKGTPRRAGKANMTVAQLSKVLAVFFERKRRKRSCKM